MVFNARWMKPLLAMGLLLLALPAWADMQARLNVVANALAQSGAQFKTLAVAGFTDAQTGEATPFCKSLESGLRRAASHSKKWKLLAAEADASKADALLTGTYSAQDNQVQVRVLLQSSQGERLGFSRSLVLSAEDLQAAKVDMPASHQPAMADLNAEEARVIPSTDEERPAPSGPRRPFHVDLSLGYKAFFPLNSGFSQRAGSRQDGTSLGLSFNDWVLVDLDYWHADVHNMGTVDGLDYFGTALAVTYPLRLGPLTLYAGPGGRFGSLMVHDTAIQDDNDQASFGNNALTAVAGAKLCWDHVGVDARYTYDLASSYTGYHTMRLGGFYEFGR